MSFWQDNVEDDLNVFFLPLFSPKKNFIKNVIRESLCSRKKLFWPIRESLCSPNAKILQILLLAKVSAPKVVKIKHKFVDKLKNRACITNIKFEKKVS